MDFEFLTDPLDMIHPLALCIPKLYFSNLHVALHLPSLHFDQQLLQSSASDDHFVAWPFIFLAGVHKKHSLCGY